MRIAVVGSGVAGLGAAWALAPRHDVVLFEADPRAGGHANTRTIDVRGQSVAVDTGFIVYNELNYPQLTRLLSALKVPSEPSDMSFAVSLDRGRVEYEGSLAGLVAQPVNLLRRSYRTMVREILRFYREAPRVLDDPLAGSATLGAYLDRHGYSRAFAEQHILPMGAAIWSARLESMRDFPVRSFVQFFVNHRLFALKGRPQWRTVTGGSRTYVERITGGLGDRVRLGAPVTAVRRHGGAVAVQAAHQPEERFDHVVLATHADQALSILGAGATGEERGVLGAFTYQPNVAVLHRDTALMPRRRRVWASWNYLAEVESGSAERAVCVSYWMNRLQSLPLADPLIVTLNPMRPPAPDKTHARILYHHPQFDRAAIEAQALLPGLQGRGGLWFCGSYCGHGFHEDGLQAGFAVAAALGAPVPWADEVSPASPAAGSVDAWVPALAAE